MSKNKLTNLPVIILVSLIIIFIASPVRFGISDGSHTGVVTAVEYNSNILWEANLVYFKTVRESSQEDAYCVNDEEIKNQLNQMQKEKKEITIYYQNSFFMWKWNCNGGQSIIYKVE